MEDFISRDAAMDTLHEQCCKSATAEQRDTIRASAKRIDALPAADVAPVVRCKNCVWQQTNHCPMFEDSDEVSGVDWTRADGFCSCGTRKDLKDKEG